MGTSVKALYNESKQDFEVVTEAAGAIAVDSAHVQLWIGANIDATHRRADIMRALNTVEGTIRENVPSYPTSSQVTSCVFTPGDATSLAVVSEGAGPAVPTEDDVAMFYDQDYVEAGGRPSASQLFKGMHAKLWERFLEDNKAA
jgi:hypothetical protein